MKQCTVCEEWKPLTAFTRAGHKDHPDRLRGDCKACVWKKTKARRDKDPARWQNQRKYTIIKNKYGLSREEYDKFIVLSKGLCEICEAKTNLVVDHCHKTRKVRGLLCNNCNTGLGMFNDNDKMLLSAVDYLRRASSIF